MFLFFIFFQVSVCSCKYVLTCSQAKSVISNMCSNSVSGSCTRHGEAGNGTCMYKTKQPRLEGTHALTGDSALTESWLLDLNSGADTVRRLGLPMTGYFHYDRSLLKPWVTGCVTWKTGGQLGQRLVCSNSSRCVLTVIYGAEWVFCLSDQNTAWQ